jgi:signal transduction histidine kinase
MATILIVDDYAANREVLVSLLKYYGHELLEAKDGVEGLAAVAVKRPDLVIADILMPTMNGFEFVSRLREEPANKELPVIFYSATFMDTEMQALAQACGVSRLIPKPAEPEEILRVVNDALSEHDPIPVKDPDAHPAIEVVQILNNKLFETNRELVTLNERLEQRIAERTSDLEKANKLLQEEIQRREKAQKEVHQLQRLDAVGKLAGGVAHDFNNLLGVILGHSEILLDRSVDPAVVRGLDVIKSSAKRGALLARQLLAFGRRQVLDPRILDVRVVLADLEKLLRSMLGENIELEFKFESKLASVEVDPGQLEQVIMNLAINAHDAMPNGGRLTFEARDVRLDEGYVARRVMVRPGSYVQLAVTDTGCGMTEEVQGHIFEPFFTTKELGKGTGLGLATVYGIVKQSGGYIWVYSEVEHGTSFKIYLPMAERMAQKREAVPLREETPPRGSETIMIVEDDPSLREVTREFLHSAGYTVLVAASPEDAVQLSDGHTGSIDFLLTDVIMPKMNGRELSSKLCAKRGDLRVLYVSGYTDGIIRDGVNGVLEPGVAFLQKPYTRHTLTRKIREMLDAREKSLVSNTATEAEAVATRVK